MRDLDLFRKIIRLGGAAQPVARGLIVELLDGCDVECPTCIAASLRLSGNVRLPEVIKRRVRSAMLKDSLSAVLLSGGEPTLHPDFLSLAAFASELDVPARVLITNGLRFATEPDFVRRFAEEDGDTRATSNRKKEGVAAIL